MSDQLYTPTFFFPCHPAPKVSVRLLKSPGEIALLREVNRATDEAHLQVAFL